MKIIYTPRYEKYWRMGQYLTNNGYKAKGNSIATHYTLYVDTLQGATKTIINISNKSRIIMPLWQIRSNDSNNTFFLIYDKMEGKYVVACPQEHINKKGVFYNPKTTVVFKLQDGDIHRANKIGSWYQNKPWNDYNKVD